MRKAFKTESDIKAKSRRDQMRALGICINGSFVPPESRMKRPRETRGAKPRIVHGPVVKAGKCQRCLDVHRKSRGGLSYVPKRELAPAVDRDCNLSSAELAPRHLEADKKAA